MLSGQKLPGYRFPLVVIGYAVWLYHRFGCGKLLAFRKQRGYGKAGGVKFRPPATRFLATS